MKPDAPDGEGRSGSCCHSCLSKRYSISFRTDFVSEASPCGHATLQPGQSPTQTCARKCGNQLSDALVRSVVSSRRRMTARAGPLSMILPAEHLVGAWP